MVPAVTVTRVAPALSGSLSGSVSRKGLMSRMILGSSLSSMVTSVAFTVSPVEVPDRVSVSSPSMMLSSVGVRVKVPVALVCPAVILMSKGFTAA